MRIDLNEYLNNHILAYAKYTDIGMAAKGWSTFEAAENMQRHGQSALGRLQESTMGPAEARLVWF